MDISIAHNLQVKARAQCAHRKIQNMYMYARDTQKREQTKHTRMFHLPHQGQHTVYKVQNMSKNRKQRLESHKSTNCT